MRWLKITHSVKIAQSWTGGGKGKFGAPEPLVVGGSPIGIGIGIGIVGTIMLLCMYGERHE